MEFFTGKFQPLDGIGTPFPSGKLYVYKDAESEKQDSYIDDKEPSANPNPIILDSAGRANLWLTGQNKLILKDSADVLAWSVDNVAGIQQSGNVQAGSANFSLDTGTADAYIATLSPAIAAYPVGLVVRLLISNTNTGASTLSVNGLGARPIRAENKPIPANLLIANEIRTFVYDGYVFHLQGHKWESGLNSFTGKFNPSISVPNKTETDLPVGGAIRFDPLAFWSSSDTALITIPAGVNKIVLYYSTVQTVAISSRYRIYKNGSIAWEISTPGLNPPGGGGGNGPYDSLEWWSGIMPVDVGDTFKVTIYTWTNSSTTHGLNASILVVE